MRWRRFTVHTYITYIHTCVQTYTHTLHYITSIRANKHTHIHHRHTYRHAYIKLHGIALLASIMYITYIHTYITLHYNTLHSCIHVYRHTYRHYIHTFMGTQVLHFFTSCVFLSNCIQYIHTYIWLHYSTSHYITLHTCIQFIHTGTHHFTSHLITSRT